MLLIYSIEFTKSPLLHLHFGPMSQRGRHMWMVPWRETWTGTGALIPTAARSFDPQLSGDLRGGEGKRRGQGFCERHDVHLWSNLADIIRCHDGKPAFVRYIA